MGNPSNEVDSTADVYLNDYTENYEQLLELSQQRAKSLKRINVFHILNTVLLVIAIILALLMGCKCKNESDLMKGGIELVQPGTSVELQNRINKAIEVGLFNVFMNTDVQLASGNANANWLIQNVETNRYLVYVEVYNKANNDLIYKSDVIQPGYKIEEAQLTKPLPAGKYDCVAYFNVLEEVGGDVKTKIGVNIGVTVKN